MPQPVTSPITSTPAQPGQPYDASDEGAVGAWVKRPGGEVDPGTGRLSGSGDNWPGDEKWQQV